MQDALSNAATLLGAGIVGMVLAFTGSWTLRQVARRRARPVIAPEIVARLNALADELGERIDRANADVLAVLRDRMPALSPDPEAILTVQTVPVEDVSELEGCTHIVGEDTGDTWEIAALNHAAGTVTLTRFI